MKMKMSGKGHRSGSKVKVTKVMTHESRALLGIRGVQGQCCWVEFSPPSTRGRFDTQAFSFCY